MTIQIAPLAALLIVVAFAIGIVVFKYTAKSQGADGRGDLVASIASGAAVATLLGLLLTPGFGQEAPARSEVPEANPGSAKPIR
ncbi:MULTISPECIES: hypothetical protein [unclassified Streptomyces]|uniref:hypothetical protein n=1 Tax=unclassified Streptomyces TaxID=2593676 RepID=UPI000DC76680|nr:MULTISPECIES: hypothetical protein [unclassified Streptomyces]AWZ06862.1 hypothetical protein DRB89_22105 [Streptomyces sp. ICC4]AWZ14559.1 hypothetical protein DRB96_22425 [Streptomyces sp. ICC1]